MTTKSSIRWVLAAVVLVAAFTLCPAEAQLSAFHSQYWSQASFGFLVPEDSDNFGRAVASGDFDGDGFADLAVGSPGEDVTVGPGIELSNAGVVTILYGSANGLTAADAQLFRQGGAGLAGVAEEGDSWGFALATGDFDGDGFDDLAVGAPVHDNEGFSDMGEVQVIYGSASGLTPTGSQAWTEFYFGVAADLLIGWTLAVGDFDGDAYDDLAVGLPGGRSNGGSGGCITGAVLVYDGSASGLVDPGGPVHYWDPGADFGVVLHCVEHFGEALAAGDVDRDGHDDLLVGAPKTQWYTAEEIFTEAGAAHLIYGSASGLTAAGHVTQLGLASYDHFGTAVAIGNVVRTSAPTNPREVVVSAPGTEVTTVDNAGNLRVCQVDDIGVHGCAWWSQATAGVDDFAETDDNFGTTLAVGNFDGDAQEDLVIGTPLEDHLETNTGMVQVLRGALDGLTTAGQQTWHQAVSGVPDLQEAGEQIGRSLAVGDFNDDGRPDLAIGVPYEPLGGFSQGAVMVLYAEGPGLIFADGFEIGTTGNWG